MKEWIRLTGKKLGREFLQVTVGCVIYALAFDLFLLPMNINPGGFSGLAMVLHHFCDLSVGAFLVILTAPLVVLGFWKLGRKFIFFSAYATVFSSYLIDRFECLPVFANDLLLASLYGGVLLGVGMGLIFLGGASTGGSDILSKLLNYYFPQIRLGYLMVSIDIVVIALSVVTFGDPNRALYAVITIGVNSKVVDMILYGMDRAVLSYIVSDRWKEIGEAIQTQLERGVTYLSAQGGYSGEDKKIVLCAVRRNESVALYDLAVSIDPSAFIIANDSHQVYGYGFAQYQRRRTKKSRG